MSDYELAQLNLARLDAPLDSPRLADFVASLDRINALADDAPGFVWRLQREAGDATAIRHFGDDVVVNMSVWRDIASLHDYVYRSAHVEVMRRRKEWFQRMEAAYSVLWWVPGGYRPTLAEADAKLRQLREQGPMPTAFTFKHAFAPPAHGVREPIPAFGGICPAG